jgi:photosystem II stability/assembly factor-like uncharacterized protein
MKTNKKLLFLTTLLVILAFNFLVKSEKTITDKKEHATLLDTHSYRKEMQLSRSKRKSKGLAPNKYYEQEYLYEMDPATGKTYPEKLIALSESAVMSRAPGDDILPWEERGPDNVPGRTRAMLYDPNDATHKRVFAGGVTGGLWVNDNIEDVNSAWQQINVAENLVVSSITADVNNSNIIYIGTGEPYVGSNGTGNGVWKSTDGGATWTHIFGGATGPAFFVNNAKVTVNTPSSIANNYIAIKSSSFGPEIPSAGVTGDFILANDSSGEATEACTSFGPSATGKIAIIDRGTCNFTDKVKNAQIAGASAVIIIQSLPGFPFGMGGEDTSVNIPSVMISKADGDLIKNTMASETVNGTILPVATSLPAGVTLVPGEFHVNDIISRDNGGVTEIYAAITESYSSGAVVGGGDSGLYRSIDGGSSWTLVTLPLSTDGNPTSINDLFISADNTLYAGSINSRLFGDGGGRIFASTDGVNFTQKFALAGASRVELAGSSTNKNKIYALIYAGSSNGTKFYKTNTAFAFGQSEIAIANDPAFQSGSTAQGWYDLAIAVDPNDDSKIFIGGNYVYKSTNGGSTWQKSSHYYNQSAPGSRVHVDIHNIRYNRQIGCFF